MRPVFGSIATTDPCSFPSASYAACCTFGSRVSSTEAPFGSCPVKVRVMLSKNWVPLVPVSTSFMESSRPVDPWPSV
jgi:hypothetical protein